MSANAPGANAQAPKPAESPRWHFLFGFDLGQPLDEYRAVVGVWVPERRAYVFHLDWAER